MKKKFLSKLLTMLLVASMVFTLLPVSTMAAYGGWDNWGFDWSDLWNWGTDDAQTTDGLTGLTSDDAATYAADNSYYRIVHLDCGRKYFTKDWIIALMTEAKAAGYNQIQLAFGNKGLRFLLEDMSVLSYTDGQVRTAIQAGNKAYNTSVSYTSEVNELTQAEMDEILTAAETIGIGVVPLFNTPFHMEAVITAMTNLGISSPYYGDNQACLNLTSTEAVGFVKALMQKYVTYFSGKGCKYFSFGADEYTGKWNDDFYSYAGSIASMITAEGMAPRVFNDSYRNGSDTYIDGVGEVCYWYTGYTGNLYASASTLKSAGKSLINTNKDYYYVVLNNGSSEYTFSGTYNEDTWINKAKQFNKNTFNNYNPINNFDVVSDGSMFCIWCDNPSARTETQIAQETRMILRVMAARMQDSDSYQATDVLVDGGFDANGAIYHKALTVTGEGVTATKGSAATASVAANKEITLTANEEVTWNYDSAIFSCKNTADAAVAAYAADATYVGRSITLIPTGTAGATTVTATNGNETVTITVTVTEVEYTTKDVYISVGETSDIFEQSGRYSAIGGNSTIATATVENKTEPGGTQKTRGDEAITSGVGVLYANGYYLTVDNSGNIGATQDINAATEVTVTKKGNSYTIQANSRYLGIQNNKGTYTLITNSRTSGNGYTWSQGSGKDYYQSGRNNQNYILAYDNGWKIDTNDGWSKAGRLYSTTEKTLPGGDVTTVSFYGVSVGDTEYIVGDMKYIVHVSNIPADAKKLYVDFWVTSNPVTPDGITTTDSGTGAARRVYATYSPAEFNMEQGVLLSGKMPQTGSYTAGGSQEVFAVSYWKTRYLPNNGRQTADGWTNKNGVGTDTKTEEVGGRDIEAIRYWNSTWEYRAVGSTDWTGFTTSADTTDNQIAAYYLIKTNITKEVTTSVTDWSDGQDYSFYGVALDFCVKYPSQDTRVPYTFRNTNTQWFNCIGQTDHEAYENGYSVKVTDETREETVGSWQGLRTTEPNHGDFYRVINYIDVTEDQGYEVYMITATPSKSFTMGEISCPETIEYTGPETVLWAESESVLENSGLEKHTDYECGGDPLIKRVMIQQCSGMLLTYYVRPKEVKNPLTVHFRVQGTTTDFASYQISPLTETAFDSRIALPDTTGHIGDLQYATIVNDKNESQTVTSDLTKVPSVPARYRRTSFECVDLQESADFTEIYLYYTFDNSAAFVVDFGLPLTITPTDINDNLADAEITAAAATNVGDKVTVNTENPEKIVITPTQAFVSEKDSVTFNLAYTGTLNEEISTVSYLITILPASNVLYEENFLKASTSGTGINWSDASVRTHTTEQQTQKVGATTTSDGISYSVFGYDDAYKTSTGDSGYWQLGSEENPLNYNTYYSNYLSTTFYGNGFDLIGDCGPDTGRVLAILTNETTKGITVIDVDTRYNDGNGEDGTTLHQVPLLHKMLTEGTYSVKIYGGGLDATTVSAPSSAVAQSTISTQAMAIPVYSYDAMLESVLQANSLTMADVEYVKVDTTPASAAAASTNGIATYAATDGTTEVKHAAGTHVEIDGFRVYRGTNNTNYPDAEQNVTYANVIDALNGEIVAYTEAKGELSVDVKGYEVAGGPQNEIYLAQNQMLIFALDDTEVNEIQVSLRAVGDGVNVFCGNDEVNSIGSSTELYYTAKKQSLGNSQVFVIANREAEGSNKMLAVGNFKFPAGITTANIVQASELKTETLIAAYSMVMNAAPVDPEPEQPVAFAPERLDASISTTRFFHNKLVTLTVKASVDVAKLTVDGRELRPTNGWLVRMGWSDTYTYVLTDTVKKNESKTYEIIAFDANGVASAAKTLSVN